MERADSVIWSKSYVVTPMFELKEVRLPPQGLATDLWEGKESSHPVFRSKLKDSPTYDQAHIIFLVSV